ncbi:hypothetical protein Tco_0904157 [Tanacetum coccineum]
MVTSRRPDFILDKVFADPILALPPPNPIETPEPSGISEHHETSQEPLTPTETRQSPTDDCKEKHQEIRETSSESPSASKTGDTPYDTTKKDMDRPNRFHLNQSVKPAQKKHRTKR